MKIAVIGAGIVGICTAYELAQDGHTVCVFESNAAIAEDASFACAGHISPSMAHSLAWPEWPHSSRLRALLGASGIALGRSTTLGDLRWLSGWKTATREFFERFASAHALVNLGQARLQALTAQSGLVFEQSQGQLLLLRSERETLAYQERLTALRGLGVTALVLTPEQARAVEPALGTDIPMHGAIHFPNDSVANCRQFAHALKDQAMAMGVVFHFNTPVKTISQSPGVQIQTERLGAQAFEQVVLCAGTGASALLGMGRKAAPLTPLWSYSLSAQVREPLNAPRSAVLDKHSGISISRMGARLRVAGAAELGGRRNLPHKGSSENLYRALQAYFPGAADFGRSIQFWKGASVFSADALPLLGPSVRSGVWLNLAHGHNGWGMACGAARVLADQIGGRSAELDTTRMHPSRFKL